GGRGHGDAPGLRRPAVEQAVLLLRRRPLAGRRPGPAPTPGLPAAWPQRPVAHVQLLRHPVDAGQVGVPLVRRVGPGLPLRRARARGPRPREVPAVLAMPAWASV